MKLFIIIFLFLTFNRAFCADSQMGSMDMGYLHNPTDLNDCPPMQVWDYAMAMCMPFPMAQMPMKMLMLHGNSFFMETVEGGPRGRSAFSAPNMLMADLGSSVGDRTYVNLDFMGTVEKWTYPTDGTPELLQVGETEANGQPYLDAQHPHSSPIMGLTLSDTIALGADKDHLKVWLTPRGESTDGPVAFMHRPTGMINPDVPLGHHIGQDVGHISSTVIGTSIRLKNSNLEISTFNGTEPSPSAVDLPIAQPNSYAARFTQQFVAGLYAMASLAYVRSPEPSEPSLDHIWRYSASVYSSNRVFSWQASNAFIWGLINGYDDASALNSFTEEFLFTKNCLHFWGRLEVLQRTPAELEIAGVSAINDGRWVTALTLGYSHRLIDWRETEWSLGGSVTEDFLPPEYSGAYGSNPVTAKVFLQLGGMAMWSLD